MEFYTSEIKKVLNHLAPIKEKVIKNKPKIPLSKETLDQMEIRDDLKAKIMAIKEGERNTELQTLYSKQRNKCQRMVFKEKTDLVNQRVKARGNKEVWKVVNNITKPTEAENKMNIMAGGVLTTDEQKIANEFNNFYIKKVRDLSEGIDKELAINPTKLLQEEQRAKNVKKKLTFKPVQEAKIYKLIRDLKPKTSFGPDEISAEMLKLGGEILCIPLTYIINRSIITEKFPSQWKIATIKPLYKKRERGKTQPTIGL